jgi:hypothetical protein
MAHRLVVSSLRCSFGLLTSLVLVGLTLNDNDLFVLNRKTVRFERQVVVQVQSGWQGPRVGWRPFREARVP